MQIKSKFKPGQKVWCVEIDFSRKLGGDIEYCVVEGPHYVHSIEVMLNVFTKPRYIIYYNFLGKNILDIFNYEGDHKRCGEAMTFRTKEAAQRFVDVNNKKIEKNRKSGKK